jgi:hypothetical protein
MYKLRENMHDITHLTPSKQRSSASTMLLGFGCAPATCNDRESFNTLEPPYMKEKNVPYASSDGEDDINIPVSKENAMYLDPKLRINKYNMKLSHY